MSGVTQGLLHGPFYSAGSRQWRGAACSGDGLNIALVPLFDFITISSDGGLSWVKRYQASNRNWRAVAISDDGMRLVASVNDGYTYTSADGGVNWTQR